MLSTYLYQLKITIYRLLLLLAVYVASRLLFLFGNHTFFSDLTWLTFLKVNFYGLRFDVFSICVASSLFILLSVLPLKIFYKPAYQRVLKWTFMLPNSVFILVNLIDVGYFKFIKKRSTADLFDQVGGQTDLGKLLPQYLMDYWWLLLIFILLLVLLSKAYSKIKLEQVNTDVPITKGSNALLWFLFLVNVGLTVIGIRGGLQRSPIDMINGGDLALPNYISVTLNTPFTLIKTVGKKALVDYQFYSELELKAIYNPNQSIPNATFKNENVVVLILESFSKEYTKLGNTDASYTPFLDSLMNHSLVFSNAFANGTRSNEGIPAILSSLPSITDNPLINTSYSSNKQQSFASLLKQKGYTSSFMHGGINGTMNFDSYSRIAGYDNYYGKNEYNNDNDFDGFWGIFDEPFLQSCIVKMSEMKQPFHTSIFTISSHHPYVIPKQHQNKFKKGTYENHESIGYGDYSLKQFFNAAKITNWYSNTLFIITADHASISGHPFYKTIVGNMAIPILFFRGDNSLRGNNNKVFSQIDILPTAMELIGYDVPFYAFGKSYSDSLSRYCYFASNGNYHVVSDSNYYVIQPPSLISKYNYHTDIDLVKPINKTNKKDSLAVKRFNAFIQIYNSTLLRNSIP